MDFIYTSRFIKALKKLPSLVKEDVYFSVEEFKNKKNHHRLRFHKLKGKMHKYHAFSANFSYRIIVKIGDKEVTFIDVGDHSIYE